MTTIAPFQVVLTVSGVLFGFLFTGFWWALNRELRFKLPQRHFKLGTGMLLAGMVLVAIFGIILPMKSIAGSDHVLVLSYRGITVALIMVFGYMLTELGHYGIFQNPKYTTKSEWVCFATALLVSMVLVIKWWLVRAR